MVEQDQRMDKAERQAGYEKYQDRQHQEPGYPEPKAEGASDDHHQDQEKRDDIKQVQWAEIYCVVTDLPDPMQGGRCVM